MRHCTQCGAATPDDARFCPRCGAPVIAAAATDPMLGKTIAERYHLVEKIGQGGSGTIYRGEHTTLKKRVAVKVLHAQLSTDDTALERFRREATTVAGIENDHILQVLDYGRTDDNRLFFAMEFLEGEPLTKVIERDKTLPIDRAVDILSQTCEALIEAHSLGYIHRDLRPRNVFLLNRRGRADFVKLLDFGLAKLILPNAEAKQTAMGMTFGDPRYMSPEQARGETLDPRSDIYSLGAIAFEMLTGTPPYLGSGTFEILQQHLDAPVPKVRDRRPDCPAWLDAAVQRALAKKAEGRFATVAKLLESLRGQAAPAAVDAAEKAEHARLSSAKPAPEPAPVQSMGPAATMPLPAPARAPSAKETQTLTTLAPKPRPEPKRGTAPAAASGSVEVTPSKIPDTVNVPSVVIEGSSNEKTAPAVPAKLPPTAAAPSTFDDRPTMEHSTAPPLPPTPADAPAPRKHTKADPTGEWFSSDSQPVPIVKGPGAYDDLDEIPRTNRGPLIIGGVAGGLILIGVIVIALLPKAEHKPLRGENVEPAKTAQAEAPKPVVTPPPSPTAPTGEPAKVETPPSAVAEKPIVAPTPTPTPTPPPSAVAAKPVVAPTTPPSAVAEKPIVKTPAPPPAVVAKTPAVVAKTPPIIAKTPVPVAAKAPAVEKPAAKEPPARVEKVKPAAEKPTRVASAERAPAAAPVERRKKDKTDGFKDPFAPDAPKATAPSAGESAQAEFFVKLGRQKLGSSDLTAAAASFNKAREYDAKSAEAVAGLGEVAFEQGDYNGAAVHLKQALKLSPNRPRYLVLLGQAYYKLGKPKDAVVEYKKALRIDPSNQEAQHSLEVAERKLQGG
jgi:serine/threonine protein kinase/Tfp pilus assembly protein PilF